MLFRTVKGELNSLYLAFTKINFSYKYKITKIKFNYKKRNYILVNYTIYKL